MCGIVGYSGKEPMKQEDLKILLYFAEERGDDSCGVATPNTILKRAEHPHHFITRSLPTDKVVLGHTRAKTVGAVTDRNAHPFENGNFIGVHNGGIRNFRTLQKQEGTNYQVDSEIIWHMFNKYGVKESLPKLQGWMGLGWIDEKNQLNLYKSSAPLWIGYKDEGLYFGSRDEYLEAMGCEKTTRLDIWTHYIINEGKIISKKDLTKHRPERGRTTHSQTNKSSGGQHTQDKGRGTGKDRSESESKDYPRGDDVPDFADFIVCDNPPDVGCFYWFSSFNKNKLYVQVTAQHLEYTPRTQEYLITDQYDVAKLDRQYPDLLNIRDIYHKIPANIR